jgi:hypothetical protein
MMAVLIALTATPLAELAIILNCGSGDIPAFICCPYVEDARKTVDPEARKILDRWINRNCRRKQ